MAFTLSQANLLKDFLSDDALKVVRALGKETLCDIPVEAVQQLREYGIIVDTKNLIDGKTVTILTEKGQEGKKGNGERSSLMKLWHIDGQTIKRGAKEIAVIVTYPPHGLAWKWKGEAEIQRYGFTNPNDVLKDVKYFHRFNPPRLVVKYRSGRIVTYR
jgi:hypothetical protein